ncbi:developmental regulator [Sporothrix brasiliensis 5110]|uniref:Developmental regulator n=1 Tax=Sporothrix brasiliensis 5110 TaxID=1398154 RepID=A0A0C2F132_9PEZI|nr:developmental regulator [Sporothrix brasiliensis 5110]KIH92564.1 developmental regulator [Sporothrix brasiliensis 5110]
MSGHLHTAYATQFGDHAIAPPSAAIKVEESVPDYMLEIRQQPQHARVALGKDKADRKPIDPPPILQLKVSHKKDPMQNFLQSPYYFMSCSLLKGDETSSKEPLPSYLIGTVVSSLHRLKDTDNQDGGFFVFGDLSCKVEGKFRLLFTLYQMQKMECVHITSIVSDTFQVYPTKSFPGLAESTFLTRSFSDQGVRLRLRKDSRSMTTRKRNATAAEFARKHQDPRDAGRRSIPTRTSSADDSLPYGATTTSGSAFDPHVATAYGHYDPDSAGLGSKRRRLGIDDVPPPPPPYTGGVPSVAAGTSDLGGYGAPRAAAYHSIGMPVSSSPYGLPIQTTTATLGYSHAAPHTHHLNRLDTQQLGGGPHGPGSAGQGTFQSPSSRHSPQHAFQYGALQASPSSMGYQPSSAASTSAGHGLTGSPAGDYRPHPGPMYTSNASADASPRTHATPNPNNTTPSGTSTSPPDATANYTAAAATGAAMTPYTQSIGTYSYAQALGDPQSHLTGAPQSMGTSRSNGLPSLDLTHVNGSGLGLDLGYGDVERHNSGQAS